MEKRFASDCGKSFEFSNGTVSEDDLNAIWGSINNLSVNEKKVIHFLNY